MMYQEQKQLWDMKVTVIPDVIGVLEQSSKDKAKRLEDLEIRGQAVGVNQNTEKNLGDLRGNEN